MKQTVTINLTESQRIQLNKIWFLYGNYGQKHTDGNHKFIQRLLDSNTYEFEFYKKTISKECKNIVDSILERF